MAEYTMTIDGKAVRGKETAGVINPATGQVFAQVPECSKAQLDEAMAAAARAYPAWSKDIKKRKEVLLACAARLQKDTDDLAAALTHEQGKPLAKAKEEIFGAAIWFKYTASLDLPVEVIQD